MLVVCAIGVRKQNVRVVFYFRSVIRDGCKEMLEWDM